jgi:hypothetical protein
MAEKSRKEAAPVVEQAVLLPDGCTQYRMSDGSMKVMGRAPAGDTTRGR